MPALLRRPPITKVGILAALGEDRRRQAGGRGLAVRAGHRDGVAEAHQLAEHLGARHHRDAPRQRRQPLRGCPADTALEITTTSASPTFVGRVADHDARAQLRQPLGHRVGLEVAALHLVAEIQQHFGDAAHAAAADADEVDAVDAAHAIAHAASSCVEARGRELFGGARPAPPARARSAMAQQFAAALAQLLQLGGEPLRREIAIRDQHRGAFAHQELRVEGLVIVDRRRERHEDRGHAHRGELGNGERAGAADHQVRIRVGAAPCRR